MTTPIDDLNLLLFDLKLKTPRDRISQDTSDAIRSFLLQEKDYRKQYRLKRLFHACGISSGEMKTFDQFDWGFNPKAPKHDILEFRNSNWIEEPANLVLIGDAGIGKPPHPAGGALLKELTLLYNPFIPARRAGLSGWGGKSHIAKALCYDAILKGYSAYFATVFDLVSKIKKAPNPAAKIDFYGKVINVLALDELGYVVYQNREDVDIIFQIVSKRSERFPTIVTTNLPPKQWGSIFSGPAASAVLDRLSFNGRFITMEGRSYRLHSKIK